MTEVGTGGAGAEDALASMRRHFTEAGLPVPPIPSALAGRLVEQEPWCWTTRPVVPIDMYLFGEYPATDLAGAPEPYVAVCHAGHGINSYAITYQLVLGPLAVYTQILWGGYYVDKDEAAAEMQDRFGKVERLIELAFQEGSAGAAARPAVVVMDSAIRGIAVCSPRPGAFGRPQDAAEWIRSQPSCDDPLGVAIERWGSAPQSPISAEAFRDRRPSAALDSRAPFPRTLRAVTPEEAARGLVVAYASANFTVYRAVVERLARHERFRMETQFGAFEVSRADFEARFPAIVASSSYTTGPDSAPGRCVYVVGPPPRGAYRFAAGERVGG